MLAILVLGYLVHVDVNDKVEYAHKPSLHKSDVQISKLGSLTGDPLGPIQNPWLSFRTRTRVHG